MELTALFPAWYIPDGLYPPFRPGQTVSLSFEMVPLHVQSTRRPATQVFQNEGEAIYRFHGRVIRVYDHWAGLLVLESEGVRFFIDRPWGFGFWEELMVRILRGARGRGTLHVEYGTWAESLSGKTNPPDLFHPLRVTRIRKVTVPERFIRREGNRNFYPDLVSCQDYSVYEVEELESMEGQDFLEELYVLEFNDEGLETEPVVPTFFAPR